MKIVEVDTFKVWASWCNWLFVRLRTDDGLEGWGESSLHGPVSAVESVVHDLATQLKSQPIEGGPPSTSHQLFQAWRWRGGPVMSSAVGALDIALWDLEGKQLGVPVARLLGGPYRTTLRAYASHWLKGVRDPEQAFAGARDAIERGFTAFKWNPFSAEAMRRGSHEAIRQAVDLMAAAREGAGADAEIYIDCSECFSPRTAVQAAEALAPYRPAWFEEPISHKNTAELARLRADMPVPIATGERLLSREEYRAVLEHGAADVIQPDVMHAGGISEVIKIAAMADAHLVSVAPHNPGGPLCTLASAHLSAAIPNFYILEQMESERTLRDAVTTTPLPCRNGHFVLPEKPGLGTEIDVNELLANTTSYQLQPLSGLRESRWF